MIVIDIASKVPDTRLNLSYQSIWLDVKELMIQEDNLLQEIPGRIKIFTYYRNQLKHVYYFLDSLIHVDIMIDSII